MCWIVNKTSKIIVLSVRYDTRKFLLTKHHIIFHEIKKNFRALPKVRNNSINYKLKISKIHGSVDHASVIKLSYRNMPFECAFNVL